MARRFRRCAAARTGRQRAAGKHHLPLSGGPRGGRQGIPVRGRGPDPPVRPLSQRDRGRVDLRRDRRDRGHRRDDARVRRDRPAVRAGRKIVEGRDSQPEQGNALEVQPVPVLRDAIGSCRPVRLLQAPQHPRSELVHDLHPGSPERARQHPLRGRLRPVPRERRLYHQQPKQSGTSRSGPRKREPEKRPSDHAQLPHRKQPPLPGYGLFRVRVSV
mmetsp:Transcript_1020/g.2556  ORF Transcript_1020/g.2556 Transcript_1020/m.2556 type:complete len:216 (-) Transcript_1020:71-718(-)